MENTKSGELQVRNDYVVLLRELSRKKFIVAAVIAVCVLISAIYSMFFVTPLYTSCAKIYVFNSSSSQINSSDFSISSYLTKDYSELIVDRTVLDEVISELDLNYSYSELCSCVTVENPENTRILEVYVKTPDAKLSQKIANKICEVSQKKIVEFMNIDRVNIFSEAYLPRTASRLGTGQAMLYGLIFGAAISAVIVLISYYKNDKICGEEDVERYLGLCTLGTIPYNQAKSAQRRKAQRAGR